MIVIKFLLISDFTPSEDESQALLCNVLTERMAQRATLEPVVDKRLLEMLAKLDNSQESLNEVRERIRTLLSEYDCKAIGVKGFVPAPLLGYFNYVTFQDGRDDGCLAKTYSVHMLWYGKEGTVQAYQIGNFI